MVEENRKFLFPKNTTYIHIAVEVVCFIVLFSIIHRKTRRLETQLKDLQKIIQEQQEMLHLHHHILSTSNLLPTNNVFIVPPPSPQHSSIKYPSPRIVECPSPQHSHIECPSPEEPPNNIITPELIEKELEKELEELKENVVSTPPFIETDLETEIQQNLI